MRKSFLPALALIGLVCCNSILHAQILKPVTWQFSSVKTGNNEYTLTFKAQIDNGWKVYSQNIPEADIRPIPTSINFDLPKKGVELFGKTEESGQATEKEEPLFDNLVIKFYHNSLTLRQVVKITQDVTIKGYVEFMACDDKQCLPPDNIEFTFDLKADKSFPIKMNTKLLQPVKWDISSEKISDTLYYINFKANIEDGWKLFSQHLKQGGPVPTSFNFVKSKISSYELIGGVEEIGNREEKKEPLFNNMTLRYFKHEALFRQKIKLLSDSAIVNGSLAFMTCDTSQCLPADEIEFAIDVKNSSVINTTAANAENIDTMQANFNIDREPYQTCGASAQKIESKSFLAIFLLGFAGGLLALLTPCVFPMIPLTVSFFTKRSQKKSRSVFEAFFYGFCIILIYALLALPFVIYKLPPDTLNAISTNVILNIVFFIIFLVFAFSFFGYYELTLPTSWLNKADSASNIGGLIGIFFMALTLALVSFSCTGPILGSLLVGTLTAQNGQLNLLTGMIGFGAALALPFGIFAAFPQLMNKLPKSGGWLNSVKVILGFIEIALAFKFLSNADLVAQWGLLKREIFFAVWALCALGSFLYLSGVIKFPHDSKIKFSALRILFAILFLSLTIYFASGIRKGANLSFVSGFPPPLFYSIYPQNTKCPLGLNCYHDFDKARAAAQKENKPIMIDFTGWACVNCRKMEENVWPDKKVFNYLNDKYILVSLYVDEKAALPDTAQYISAFTGKKIKTVGNKWSDFESTYFGKNSQPYYVLISPDGKVLNNPVPYTPDAKEYSEFLQCGLDAFQQLNTVAKE